MTEKPDHPFAVINGTPAPDTPDERRNARMRATGEATGCWCCPSCGSLTFVEVRNAVPKKRAFGAGTKLKACAMCLMKGRLVKMT